VLIVKSAVPPPSAVLVTTIVPYAVLSAPLT
jgi:hypothetical protein